MWAVGLHRTGLKMLGLWPKNHKFTKESLWSKLHAGIILILLIFVCNVPMIYAITQIQNDMVLVVGNIQCSLPMVVTSIKYIIMRWKQTGTFGIN